MVLEEAISVHDGGIRGVDACASRQGAESGSQPGVTLYPAKTHPDDFSACTPHLRKVPVLQNSATSLGSQYSEREGMGTFSIQTTAFLVRTLWLKCHPQN